MPKYGGARGVGEVTKEQDRLAFMRTRLLSQRRNWLGRAGEQISARSYTGTLYLFRGCASTPSEKRLYGQTFLFTVSFGELSVSLLAELAD